MWQTTPSDLLTARRTNRAFLSVMACTFARVSAVTSLKGKDYLQMGRRSLIRLHEKGGKERDIPCHHRLEEYLNA